MDRPFFPEKRRRSRGLLMIGVLFLGIIAGGAPGLAAREADGENKLDRAFLGRFKRDFAAVITSPARWTRRDLLTLAAVSGTGLLIMAFDHDIQDWAQARRSESSDQASSFFTQFGNGAVLVGLSAAVYAAGAVGHNDGWRKTALLSLESLATASFIVWTTKVIAGRARPYTGESSGSFHPFSLENSFWSLPSGHAAAAFSVATAIALQSKSAFVDLAAYGLATMVGFARIHDDKHWASDVFIGSALGYFVAKKIARLNRPGEKPSVSWGFQSSRGRQAVTLNIAF